MTDKAIQFQKEFEALIRKYKPDVDVDFDLYSDAAEAIHFVVDKVIVVTKPVGYRLDSWDFGRGWEKV